MTILTPSTQNFKLKKREWTEEALMNISAADIEKKAAKLKSKIAKAKTNGEKLRKDIEEREQRFYKREKEYREIIADLQKQLKSRTLLNEKDEDYHINFLKDTNYKINDNIDLIQSKTTKVLAEQEKDIIRFYNSKIKELQHQFEEENIKKGKK